MRHNRNKYPRARGTIRARMTLSMLYAAALVIPVVVLSLFYIRRMNDAVGRIVDKNIELMHIGDQIQLDFLQARRDEKNFLLYGDSIYLGNSHASLEHISELCSKGRKLGPDLATSFDAIISRTSIYRRLADSITMLSPGQVFIPNRARLQQDHEKLLKAAASAQDTSRRDSLLAAAAKLASKIALPIPAGQSGRLLNDSIYSLQAAIAVGADSVIGFAQQRVLCNRRRARQLAAWGQRNIITVLLLVLAVLGWLVFTLPKRTVLPIKRIANALRRAEEGNLDIHVTPRTKDELGQLARQLNRAFARLREFDESKVSRILYLERRFRLLANDISEGVLVVDRIPNVVLANQAMEPLLGRPASEVAGRQLTTFPNLIFLQPFLEKILAGAASRKTCDILPQLPGSVVCIESLRDQTGEVTGALIVITHLGKPGSTGGFETRPDHST